MAMTPPDRAAGRNGPPDLRESERQLRAIFELAGVGMAQADAATGSYLRVNQKYCEITGYRADELLARTFREITHPDDRARDEELIRSVLEGRAGGWTNEKRYVRKDGTVIWVQVDGSVVRDDEGRPERIIGVIQDITARRQAEEALRESRERLDRVAQSTELGLWYCDLPFDRLDWNEKCKEHFGLPADYDVTIDTFYERMHPEDRQCTRERIERALAEHTKYDCEYRTVGLDGKQRWIRAIGSGFYDENGRPVRFDGVTVDITRQKAIEEALKEADRRKDQFLAMLAHELRNPLAAISSSLQLQETCGISEADLLWARQVMDRQLRQLTGIVDDLLDVSRITRGKVQLKRERLELSVLVQQAVETVRPLIDSHGHNLSISLPDQPICIDGDPTRLEQVLVNLLTNACKYTPERGQIWLSADLVHDRVVAISVRDTGMGIPAPMLPQIFDLFTQLDGSLDRSQGGLGIGLTLVRALVEMHGGQVTASSDGAGRGSEFTVRLPVARHPLPSAAPAGAAVQQGERCRVLVVDDNIDAARGMALLLEADGHEVHRVCDGAEAIEAAKSFRPAVVLLDIGLPGIDGYEVARRIKSSPTCGSPILIAVSGYGQSEDRRRSTAAGFKHHLVKPIDYSVLRSLLAESTDAGRSQPQRAKQ